MPKARGGPPAEKGAPAAGCGGGCAQHAWPLGPTSGADLVTLVTLAQLCHDHPACWAFQDQTQTVQIPSQGPRAWRENDGRACVRGSQPQVRRDQRSQARPRQGTCSLPPSRLPGCLSDWREDQPCGGLFPASALTRPQVAGPRRSSQSLLHKQPCGGRGCSWAPPLCPPPHHEPPVGCPWALGGGQARPINRGLSSGLCSSCRPPSLCLHCWHHRPWSHTQLQDNGCSAHVVDGAGPAGGPGSPADAGPGPGLPAAQLPTGQGEGLPCPVPQAAQGPVTGGGHSLGPSCLPGKRGAERKEEADHNHPRPWACGDSLTERAELL